MLLPPAGKQSGEERHPGKQTWGLEFALCWELLHDAGRGEAGRAGWMGWLLKSLHPLPRKISLAKEMQRLLLAAVQF